MRMKHVCMVLEVMSNVVCLQGSKASVARGVGQFSLLTLCSASICHAGPKLHVTVWQDVMTKLIIRMGLWSGEEGLFIGQQSYPREADLIGWHLMHWAGLQHTTVHSHSAHQMQT